MGGSRQPSVCLTTAVCLLVLIGRAPGQAVPEPPKEYPTAEVACWWVATSGGPTTARDPSVPAELRLPNGGGWRALLEARLGPALRNENPPRVVIVHAVGPKWAAVRDGEPAPKSRVFEFDWPATHKTGRIAEGGVWRWPPLPQYGEGFVETMRDLARGTFTNGKPVELWAYTGKLQLWHLENLREHDPDAYREHLRSTVDWFRRVGFARLYVDALSDSRTIPATHEGLLELAALHRSGSMPIGGEAYPPAAHDAVAGDLPWLALWRNWSTAGDRPNATKKPRPGVVVCLGKFGQEMTPEVCQSIVDAGCTPAIGSWDWPRLAPRLSVQNPGAETEVAPPSR